jgi:outer membrane beta-barrel protein
MRLQNTSMVIALAMVLASANTFAQSKQYQRKQPDAGSAPTTAAPAGAPKASAAAPGAKPGAPAAGGTPAAAGAPTDQKSDKLDISDLEQKYWAPKDTDFSVVQNRTYTKAKRFALSLQTGPAVNDPFNAGFNYAGKLNYYLDERYGFEFQFIKADLTDSDSTKKFKTQLSGGDVPPDFNRPENFYGVGFNWVPFYAKMSVLGSKIIYFDMQFTPLLGISQYEQQNQVKESKKTAFTYGLDITQYYFVSKTLAYRFDYQNRWSHQDVLAYQTGIKKRSETDNTSLFLLGVTLFF